MTHSQSNAYLRMAVETRAGWTLVRLAGELDYATAGDLRGCLEQLVSAGQTRIALELSALTFCDTSGIGCFVGAWKRTRQAGGELVLLRSGGQVARLLNITGLDKFLSSRDEPPAWAPSNGGEAGPATTL